MMILTFHFTDKLVDESNGYQSKSAFNHVGTVGRIEAEQPEMRMGQVLDSLWGKLIPKLSGSPTSSGVSCPQKTCPALLSRRRTRSPGSSARGYRLGSIHDSLGLPVMIQFIVDQARTGTHRYPLGDSAIRHGHVNAAWLGRKSLRAISAAVWSQQRSPGCQLVV